MVLPCPPAYVNSLLGNKKHFKSPGLESFFEENDSRPGDLKCFLFPKRLLTYAGGHGKTMTEI